MILQKVYSPPPKGFCKETLQRGTVMSAIEILPNHLYPIVAKVAPDTEPDGLLLQDVVNMDDIHGLPDTTRQQFVGGIVEILTRGIVVMDFPACWKLPKGQPLYVNKKNGKLTWRKSGMQVGITDSPQDANGFCKVEVNFREGFR